MGLFRRSHGPTDEPNSPHLQPSVPVTSIGDIVERRHVAIAGQVLGIRVRPSDTLPTYVARIGDDSGSITVIWTGRRTVGGVGLGRRIRLEGTPVKSPDGLCIYNPTYTLLT